MATHTLIELARELGCKPSEVLKIERRAMRRFRAELARRGINRTQALEALHELASAEPVSVYERW